MLSRPGRHTRTAVLTCALSFLVLLPFAIPAAVAAPTPSEETLVSTRSKALEKLGWKLSCQAYTFRELSLFETIDTLQRLGIRYIEIYPGQRLDKDRPGVTFDHNAPPEMIKAVRQRLREAGITAVNYGVVGLPNDEAEARKVFEFARALRLQTIVSEPPEDAFPMLDRLCGEYGINVAIHNHPQPSHYWNPDTVLKVTQGRSARIGACADTGHWYRSGLVPTEALRKLEGRIVSLHFKDLNTDRRDVPWGTGVLDVPGMLAELKRQGVKPVFSIEYESTSGTELEQNVARCVRAFHEAADRLVEETHPAAGS